MIRVRDRVHRRRRVALSRIELWTDTEDTALHRLWRRLDDLSPVQFVLFLGLIAGTVQGIPSLLESSPGGIGGQTLHVAAAVAGSALWWCAAVVFGWSAIRGLRFSLWRTAGQMTLAWAIGDLVAAGLAFVGASIQTQGGFVHSYVNAPFWTGALPGLLGPTILHTPARLVGSIALLAVGRFLLDRRGPSTPPTSRPADHEAVT